MDLLLVSGGVRNEKDMYDLRVQLHGLDMEQRSGLHRAAGRNVVNRT